MMSTFTTPAILKLLDNKLFVVEEKFEFKLDHPELGKDVIKVPKDFVTDLASTPRALWWLFPPIGRYAKAAIVHDYLYVAAYKNKRFADKVFYEAMGVLGVPLWKRKIMYLAVKLFGKGNYKE